MPTRVGFGDLSESPLGILPDELYHLITQERQKADWMECWHQNRMRRHAAHVVQDYAGEKWRWRHHLLRGRSDYELASFMFEKPPKLLDVIRRLLRALVYA